MAVRGRQKSLHMKRARIEKWGLAEELEGEEEEEEQDHQWETPKQKIFRKINYSKLTDNFLAYDDSFFTPWNWSLKEKDDGGDDAHSAATVQAQRELLQFLTGSYFSFDLFAGCLHRRFRE